MNDELLVVENLGKNFGYSRLLNDINFSVNKGEIVGIIGVRGAGKRLLLELIAGHQFPDTGEIKYKGASINNYKAARRQKSGIENNLLPYKYGFFKRLQYARKEPTWNQRINDKLLEFGYHDKKGNIDRISSTFQMVGLDTLAMNNTNFVYSAGQKQRYQLAELIITKPQLIILDEPFKYFDAFTIENYIYILKSVSSVYSISFLISDRSSLLQERKFIQSTLFAKCYDLKKGRLFPVIQNHVENNREAPLKNSVINEMDVSTQISGKYIFISYSRTDIESAENIIELLLMNNINTWIDRKGIEYGSRWDDEIEKAILGCRIMIVLLSPNSVNSGFVSDEYSYAIDNNITVFPILIEDCSIPLRLHRVQYFDYRNINEDVNEILIEKLTKSIERS